MNDSSSASLGTRLGLVLLALVLLAAVVMGVLVNNPFATSTSAGTSPVPVQPTISVEPAVEVPLDASAGQMVDASPSTTAPIVLTEAERAAVLGLHRLLWDAAGRSNRADSLSRFFGANVELVRRSDDATVILVPSSSARKFALEISDDASAIAASFDADHRLLRYFPQANDPIPTFSVCCALAKARDQQVNDDFLWWMGLELATNPRPSCPVGPRPHVSQATATE